MQFRIKISLQNLMDLNPKIELIFEECHLLHWKYQSFWTSVRTKTTWTQYLLFSQSNWETANNNRMKKLHALIQFFIGMCVEWNYLSLAKECHNHKVSRIFLINLAWEKSIGHTLPGVPFDEDSFVLALHIKRSQFNDGLTNLLEVWFQDWRKTSKRVFPKIW